MYRLCFTCCLLIGVYGDVWGGENFSTGEGAAAKFGVHEVELSKVAAAGNPFDVEATVTFRPPSGGANAKTVPAFYDGQGTWRARVYVSEVGEWRWTSQSAAHAELHGK